MMNEIARGPYRPGVGLVIFNDEKRVMAGLRMNRDPMGPNWQLPQGGRNPGEDMLAAAYREMREETGMTPDEVTFERALPETTRYDWPSGFSRDKTVGQEHTWAVFRKLNNTLPDLSRATDFEFDRMAWLSLEGLLGCCQPFRIAVYQSVRRQLGL